MSLNGIEQQKIILTVFNIVNIIYNIGKTDILIRSEIEERGYDSKKSLTPQGRREYHTKCRREAKEVKRILEYYKKKVYTK